jgi:hypothetical protein
MASKGLDRRCLPGLFIAHGELDDLQIRVSVVVVAVVVCGDVLAMCWRTVVVDDALCEDCLCLTLCLENRLRNHTTRSFPLSADSPVQLPNLTPPFICD